MVLRLPLGWLPIQARPRGRDEGLEREKEARNRQNAKRIPKEILPKPSLYPTPPRSFRASNVQNTRLSFVYRSVARVSNEMAVDQSGKFDATRAGPPVRERRNDYGTSLVSSRLLLRFSNR